MANEFIIKHGFHSKGDSQVTGSLNVSDSLTVNGSAVGAAFPFTGDAQITGSLTISGSFEAFTLDSDNIVLGSGSGKLMQAGADSNVLIGTTLGQALTTGDQNVFIGTNAGNQVSTTTQNVFIGSSAGNTRTGTRNVALGDSAGSGTYNISANDLIAIGTYAGRNNAGSGNIAIGYYAMPTNAGSYSVALGYLSMGHNGGGAGNTAIGGYTLRYAPAASVHQVAVGTYAGQFSYGNGNILIGYKAGEYLQSNAHGNIIIGSGSIGNSGEVNQLRVGHTGSMTLLSGSFTTGDIIFANTASAPNFSGSFQGDGSNLTGVSAFPFTGDAQITGSLTISGSLQLDYNGVGNMIIGSGSGKVLESGGINNLIFGNNAATSLTTGDQNVIIGNRAGDSSNLNIESNNVYVGYEAGKDATHQASYGDNVFIGTQAGKDSKAQFSQFIGSNAGNGTAAFSTGIGHSNLSCTSEHSVAIGYQSQTNGTNHYNTSIGSFALQSNNGGANNERTVAIGYYAAQNSYNVDDGIYIGYYAGANVNTGQGNIVIGSGSLLSPANYQLRIGHADIHVISGSLTTGDVIFYNTASAPNFSGSFQGDGSNLTGTGTTVVGNSGTGDILDSITIGGTGFDVTTGTVTTTNGSSNRIATYNTTTQIDGSDNLTFDGSNLKVVGDTHMTGSLNISGSTTIELPTGTAFEILEGDKDQQSRLIFDYSNGDPTLTVASRASTAKMVLRQDTTTNGLYLDENGNIYVNNSTTDGIKVNGTTLASIGTNANALDLGSDTRPWKDLYLQLGGDIVYTTSNENMRIQHINPNKLRISGSDSVPPSFEVLEGSITASNMLINNGGEIGNYANNWNIIGDRPEIRVASNLKIFNQDGASQIAAFDAATNTTLLSGSLTVGGTTSLSTVSGRIDAKNDVVAFSTSDERLKDNITPIENALNKVSQVQGIEFDWIPKEGVHGNEGHDVGVLAQELEKVLPEVVTTRDNGYKAVKYEKIIPLLIEAIKELQAEVQELKNTK